MHGMSYGCFVLPLQEPTMNKRKTIGLLGGTFDPIHHGHLRAAIEIYEQLHLDEIRLIPCKIPPHKISPFGAVKLSPRRNRRPD